MQEHFIQFIWQFQYFDKTDLKTSNGFNIKVFNPGTKNNDAGPDFLQGKITLDDIEWNGNIEIHINSSGWSNHKHQLDPSYNNVILHVVWKNDRIVYRQDNTEIPTLELKDKVDPELLLKYNSLIHNKAVIHCGNQPALNNQMLRAMMIESTTVERLDMKSREIKKVWIGNNNDWEETAYQLIAKNFGFKINSQCFSDLACSLPYKLIVKHTDNLMQLEALLFGQAGLLENKLVDDYQRGLAKEYNYLKHKYGLKKKIKSFQWKYLRTRPANFPTVRIAQLGKFLLRKEKLFTWLIELNSYKDFKEFCSLGLNGYWKSHYNFGVPGKTSINGLGAKSIENLAINSWVPLLFFYGRERDEIKFIDKALDILQQLPAEKNSKINEWVKVGVTAKSAFESQGLLQLVNSYCNQKRCLSCKIGVNLLKR